MTAEDPSDDTGVTVLESLNNGTLCISCNLTSEYIVLIHSTSNPQHLGVHTSQGANRTCANASTCSGSNCTVAVYQQSRGLLLKPDLFILG